MKLSAIFKEKLNEASDWGDEHDRLTKQEIEDWCKSMRLHGCRVVKEGDEFVIDASEDVRIRADDLPLDDNNMCYLPHPFGEVNGNFIIIGNGREKLRSLKNGPHSVYGRYQAATLGLESLEGMAGSVQDLCDLSHNKLKNWDGIPSQCGDLEIYANEITSFKGISRNWVMGNSLKCDVIDNNVLELLQIEGLESVEFKIGKTTKPLAEIKTAKKLINHHLRAERDTIDMQSDFIDADMADWIRK